MRGRQAVVMRTTSNSIFERGTRALAAALNHQLHGKLTLLVDTTYCVASFCDAEWIGRSLEVSTWGYSADDIARRWPAVVWPVLGLTNAPNPRDAMRCWLVARLARYLASIGKKSWPQSRTARGHSGLNVSRCLQTTPELSVVNYLIHEPSVILWWLANGREQFEHVWVLEDDVFFGGSATRFFRRFELQSADMISLFCDFNQECTPQKRDRATQSGLPGHAKAPDHYADDGRFNSRGNVHHWEHVVRLSGRLLLALDTALEDGYVLHGENFASTFCIRHAPWCTTQDVRSVDGASPSMREDNQKVSDIRMQSFEERWYHVQPYLLCSLLMKWVSFHERSFPLHGAQWIALQSSLSLECAQQRPWEANHAAVHSVDLLGARDGATARAVAPIVRLIETQRCDKCCTDGRAWCCFNSTAWREEIRRL
jgi:hypothetical protein